MPSSTKKGKTKLTIKEEMQREILGKLATPSVASQESSSQNWFLNDVSTPETTNNLSVNSEEMLAFHTPKQYNENHPPTGSAKRSAKKSSGSSQRRKTIAPDALAEMMQASGSSVKMKNRRKTASPSLMLEMLGAEADDSVNMSIDSGKFNSALNDYTASPALVNKMLAAEMNVSITKESTENKGRRDTLSPSLFKEMLDSSADETESVAPPNAVNRNRRDTVSPGLMSEMLLEQQAPDNRRKGTRRDTIDPDLMNEMMNVTEDSENDERRRRTVSPGAVKDLLQVKTVRRETVSPGAIEKMLSQKADYSSHKVSNTHRRRDTVSPGVLAEMLDVAESPEKGVKKQRRDTASPGDLQELMQQVNAVSSDEDGTNDASSAETRVSVTRASSRRNTVSPGALNAMLEATEANDEEEFDNSPVKLKGVRRETVSPSHFQHIITAQEFLRSGQKGNTVVLQASASKTSCKIGSTTISVVADSDEDLVNQTTPTNKILEEVKQQSVLRSCLSDRKKKAATPGKSVVFGSPRASEFRRGSPPVSMTPMCNREAKVLFPLDSTEGNEGDDESDDAETSLNSSILEDADNLEFNFSAAANNDSDKRRRSTSAINSGLQSPANKKRRRRSSFGPKSKNGKRKRRNSLFAPSLAPDAESSSAANESPASLKKADTPSGAKKYDLDSSDGEDMDITEDVTAILQKHADSLIPHKAEEMQHAHDVSLNETMADGYGMADSSLSTVAEESMVHHSPEDMNDEGRPPSSNSSNNSASSAEEHNSAVKPLTASGLIVNLSSQFDSATKESFSTGKSPFKPVVNSTEEDTVAENEEPNEAAAEEVNDEIVEDAEPNAAANDSLLEFNDAPVEEEVVGSQSQAALLLRDRIRRTNAVEPDAVTEAENPEPEVTEEVVEEVEEEEGIKLNNLSELFAAAGCNFKVKSNEGDNEKHELPLGPDHPLKSCIPQELVLPCINQAYVDNYGFGCAELSSYQDAYAEQLEEMEKEMLELLPDLFTENTSPKVLQALVNQYSNDQLNVLGDWYNWKSKIQKSILDHLDIHLSMLSEDEAALDTLVAEAERSVTELNADVDAMAELLEKELKMASLYEDLEDQSVIQEEYVTKSSELQKQLDQLSLSKSEHEQTIAALEKQESVPRATVAQVKESEKRAKEYCESYIELKKCMSWTLTSLNSTIMKVKMPAPDGSDLQMTITMDPESPPVVEVECIVNSTHVRKNGIIRRMIPLSKWLFRTDILQADATELLNLYSSPMTLFFAKYALLLQQKFAFFDQVVSIIQQWDVNFEPQSQSIVVWFSSFDINAFVHFPIKFQVTSSNIVKATIERPLEKAKSLVNYGEMNQERLDLLIRASTNNETSGGFLYSICEAIQNEYCQ